MKRSADFLVRQVAGQFVAVPLGKAAARFNGMLTLNATGVFLWEQLEQEKTVEQLARALCEKYDVSLQQATEDVTAFAEKLMGVGAIIP